MPVPLAVKNCIQLASCDANQLLPMNPELPADLFTSCLTTPIKVALRWWVFLKALLEVIFLIYAMLKMCLKWTLIRVQRKSCTIPKVILTRLKNNYWLPFFRSVSWIPPKNFTFLLGKLRTGFTSPIAKSTTLLMKQISFMLLISLCDLLVPSMLHVHVISQGLI